MEIEEWILPFRISCFHVPFSLLSEQSLLVEISWTLFFKSPRTRSLNTYKTKCSWHHNWFKEDKREGSSWIFKFLPSRCSNPFAGHRCIALTYSNTLQIISCTISWTRVVFHYPPTLAAVIGVAKQSRTPSISPATVLWRGLHARRVFHGAAQPFIIPAKSAIFHPPPRRGICKNRSGLAL